MEGGEGGARGRGKKRRQRDGIRREEITQRRRARGSGRRREEQGKKEEGMGRERNREEAE